ncbi:MAG: DUF1636 family protein [Cognatishimia sp.]
MFDQKACRIAVCTSCKDKQSGERQGYALIETLRASLAADPQIDAQFQVSGVACMAGCDRPCTVGFHGQGKASYLFGDMTHEQDVADIVAFAKQYATLQDGWCSSVDRPGKLRKSTLARIPATLFSHPMSAEAAE